MYQPTRAEYTFPVSWFLVPVGLKVVMHLSGRGVHTGMVDADRVKIPDNTVHFWKPSHRQFFFDYIHAMERRMWVWIAERSSLKAGRRFLVQVSPIKNNISHNPPRFFGPSPLLLASIHNASDFPVSPQTLHCSPEAIRSRQPLCWSHFMNKTWCVMTSC